jgi:class 3 adenylate cyclase/predicted ATPase
MSEEFGTALFAATGAKNARASAGERRQITALFYDIVNSTALLQTLDPEDFGIAQRRVHSEAAAVFEKYGGYLERILGDGGCAYFGYPAPVEDAAEAAVSAALELVERCQSLEERGAAVQLQVRVGVATGVTVLSSMRGTNLPGETEIIGLAPALASRIQSEAEPNSVAVSDSTHQVTGPSFEFEMIGVREIKGFDEPQRIWRPVAKRAVLDRFSALRRPDMPLVARDDELDLCRRRWVRAIQGHGQVVFVVGEAGIGKSRLVAEVLRESSVTECDTHVFQCQPRGNTRPLHPFVDRIRREIGTFSQKGTKPDPDSVREYISLTAPGLSESSLDMLLFLLEAELDSDQTQAIALQSTDEFRRRAVGSAIELLSAWSRFRPQLLLIEDIHWADTLTQSLLSRLVDEVAHLRALLLVTTRELVADELVGDPHVIALALARLDATAIPTLVEAAWAPTSPPPGLAAFIEEKSDGVPLFVEELAHLLKERLGDAPAEPAEWDRILKTEGVTTLRDLLSARIGALGEARRVAQVASVIGRDFSYDLLASIFERNGLAALLDERLEVLVKAGVVRRRSHEERLTFRFRHVLLQEAAYDGLLKSERRELHDRIVGLVVERAVVELPDDVMAWHCAQAGRPLEAARYAVRAAESCAMRSAVQEAERLLSTAEECLEVTRPGPDADKVALQCLAARGPVAVALYGKGSPQARATYERGVAICREKDIRDRERWFPVYWGWWFTAPDFATQQKRSEVLLADLESAADAEIRLQALHCAWATSFHSGRHAECLDYVARGLALYDPDRARMSRIKYGGHDAKVCALGERALSLWFVGDDHGSAASIDDTLSWAEELEHIGSLIHALDYAIVLRRYQGDPLAVAGLAQRLEHLAREHALTGARVKAQLFSGWAWLLTASPAASLEQFEIALQSQREIGTEENLSIYLDMKSEILAQAGRYDEALKVLNDTIESSRRIGQLFWLAELYRKRALLSHAMGHDQGAVLRDLQQAMSLARGQGAHALAARARFDLDTLGRGTSSHQS